MFEMKAKVIVDAGDILSYAEKHRDMPWNAAHDVLFRSYDCFLSYENMIVDRDSLLECDIEPVEIELLTAFMDHHELDEFYWAGH